MAGPYFVHSDAENHQMWLLIWMLFIEDLDPRPGCLLHQKKKKDKNSKFPVGLNQSRLKTDGCSFGRAVVKGEIG